MPPPRLRVEERGRRLVVADRGIARPMPSRTPDRAGPGSRALAAIGMTVIRVLALGATTHRVIYTTIAMLDTAAPREIIVGRADAARLGLLALAALATGLAAALLLVLKPPMLVGMAALVAIGLQLFGTQIRKRTTAIFDRLEDAAPPPGM